MSRGNIYGVFISKPGPSYACIAVIDCKIQILNSLAETRDDKVSLGPIGVEWKENQTECQRRYLEDSCYKFYKNTFLNLRTSVTSPNCYHFYWADVVNGKFAKCKVVCHRVFQE